MTSNVCFGPFRLDREQKLLFRDGEAVPLTPKAFEMLDLLVRNGGRVLEKDELMRGVWPDTFVDEANLSQHVFMLRRALGDDREGSRFIQTIPRRGYRFIAPLSDDGGTPPTSAAHVVIDERSRQQIVIEEDDSEPRRRDGLAVRLLVPLLAIIIIGSLAALFRARPQPRQPNAVRVAIAPPPATQFIQIPVATSLAVSPDGRALAIVAHEGQRRRLFVRSFDALNARPIAGTDDAMGPFWSPDSKWIGFFAGGMMKKVPLDGGPAQTIGPAKGGMASWHSNGQIVFCEWGPGSSEGIRLVHESGGAVRDVTDAKQGWGLWPSFLPDGRHFIFYWVRPEKFGLYVGSIDGDQPRLVVPVKSRGEVRGEEVFYVREGVLVRQKLDMKKLAVVGDPSPIADGVFCFTPLGTSNFSLSRDGSVIAWQRRMLATQLVWRDWNGRELARVGKPEHFRKFSMSPDGQRIASDVADATTEVPSVWVFDLARGVGTQVASFGTTVTSPLWNPAGDALMLGVADEKRPMDPPALSLMYLADGSMRFRRKDAVVEYATDMTADGARVIYTVNRGRYSEMEMMAIANPDVRVPIESSPTWDTSDGVLSPDDRWLAYTSGESGRPEIYLRPFDRTGEKIRISTMGGSEPQWSVDGDAILFISPEGMLMKADLARGDRPRVTKETILFPISSAGMMAMTTLGQSHYAVTRDRVLTREIPGGIDADPVTVLFTGK